MQARKESETLPDIEQLVVAAAGAMLIGLMYLALPSHLTFQPSWLLLPIEALLLAPPLISVLYLRRALPYGVARGLALVLLAVVTAALIGTVGSLVRSLPTVKNAERDLLIPAGLIWSINVLVFAVWYWEIDGGGPLRRHRSRERLAEDFQFPQQAGGNPTRWLPGFVDYVYLAFCTATALSPADTVPLRQRAKLLMMVEALISLLLLVLVVARSVNIISG